MTTVYRVDTAVGPEGIIGKTVLRRKLGGKDTDSRPGDDLEDEVNAVAGRDAFNENVLHKILGKGTEEPKPADPTDSSSMGELDAMSSSADGDAANEIMVFSRSLFDGFSWNDDTPGRRLLQVVTRKSTPKKGSGKESSTEREDLIQGLLHRTPVCSLCDMTQVHSRCEAEGVCVGKS